MVRHLHRDAGMALTSGAIWLSLLALLLAGCVAEGGSDTSEPAGKSLGELQFGWSCNAEERAKIAAAHVLGKELVMTDTFAEFVHASAYRPCRYEPTWSRPSREPSLEERRSEAVRLARQWSDVKVVCRDLGSDVNARALHGSPELQGVEHLKLGHRYLETTASRVDIAGTLWHEIMHQRGYRHPEEDDDASYCGYSEPSHYHMWDHAMPYIVDSAIVAAARPGSDALPCVDGYRADHCELPWSPPVVDSASSFQAAWCAKSYPDDDPSRTGLTLDLDRSSRTFFGEFRTSHQTATAVVNSEAYIEFRPSRNEGTSFYGHGPWVERGVDEALEQYFSILSPWGAESVLKEVELGPGAITLRGTKETGEDFEIEMWCIDYPHNLDEVRAVFSD